jgi:hypothetical protein
MDEEEFYTVIFKNAIVALILVGALWLVATIVDPIVRVFLGIGTYAISVPIEYFIIGWLTFFVIGYVFKLWEGLPWHASAWKRLTEFGILTIILYNILLTCGEMVGASLIIVGILMTVLFIVGEAILTAALTYREFNNWAEKIKISKPEDRVPESGLSNPGDAP